MQIKIITLILVAYYFINTQNNEANFEISIERKFISDTCIEGYLTINNSPICYTMELPNRGNLNDISSIPKGKYSAFIRTDKKLGWRIELVDVPEREHIQIHLGNFTTDITGCTLVGKDIDIDKCTVKQSKAALKEIEELLKNFKSDLCLDCNTSQQYEIEVEYK